MEEGAQPHAAYVTQFIEVGNDVLDTLCREAFAGAAKPVRILSVHAAAHFEQDRLIEFRRLDVQDRVFFARFHCCAMIGETCTLCNAARGQAALTELRMPVLGEGEIDRFRPKVRFRLARQVGWACADLDDLVQETLARLLLALRDGKITDAGVIGGFLNAVCRNVVHEYHRRIMRDDVMPEIMPDPADNRLSGAQQFDIRNAISTGLAQLSPRDREILHALYIEEKSRDEILADSGLTYEQFRVVLCRAKERFRTIYNSQVKQRTPARHSRV